MQNTNHRKLSQRKTLWINNINTSWKNRNESHLAEASNLPFVTNSTLKLQAKLSIFLPGNSQEDSLSILYFLWKRQNATVLLPDTLTASRNYRISQMHLDLNSFTSNSFKFRCRGLFNLYNINFGTSEQKPPGSFVPFLTGLLQVKKYSPTDFNKPHHAVKFLGILSEGNFLCLLETTENRVTVFWVTINEEKVAGYWQAIAKNTQLHCIKINKNTEALAFEDVAVNALKPSLSRVQRWHSLTYKWW